MADRFRRQLIAALVVAAVISGVGNVLHRPVVGWIGFLVFGAALVLYARWRRAALAERRRGDEARARADR